MTEPLIKPSRWAGRRQRALTTPMTSATAFADLPDAGDQDPAPHDQVTRREDMGPVAAYLTGQDDSWCAHRRGVWWPTVGLWVDRLELTAEDVPPPGARTYPLVPPAGFDIGAVHGQIDAEGVAHVLVTGPGGEVVTQVSVAGAQVPDLPLTVVATLVAATGGAEDPTKAFLACTTDKVLGPLARVDWAAGWSLEVDDLPARVAGILGLYRPLP